MEEQVDPTTASVHDLTSKLLPLASRQYLQAKVEVVHKALPASLSIARVNFQFSLVQERASNHTQEAPKNDFILYVFVYILQFFPMLVYF